MPSAGLPNYRLDVGSLCIPSLRERPGDVELLARAFVCRDARSLNPRVTALGERALAQQERNLIEDALRQARGNLSRAAARLRIPRTTLLGRMRRLGLPASLDPPA